RLRDRVHPLEHLAAGEDAEDARQRLGARGVDRADARVRERAAQDGRVGHAGKLHIVDELPPPGDEAGVRRARNRLADVAHCFRPPSPLRRAVSSWSTSYSAASSSTTRTATR